MDLPRRKSLRLHGYDYRQNFAYFVTVCVKNKLQLLGEIVVGDDAHIVPNIVDAHIVPNIVDAHIVPDTSDAPKIKLSDYGIITKKYIENINDNSKNICVDKCVIMPNHIHMIIAVQDGTMWASSPTCALIPNVVRSFKTLVSKQIGFSLWQRSYHDHIIRNDQEFQKIWQYIDENPQRWNDDCYYAK